MMELEEILSAIPVFKTNQSIKNIKITGLENDHRKIKDGNMFICLKGFTVDGHDFAEQAVENGATVIVAEKEMTIQNVIVIVVPDTMRALAMLAAKFYNYPSNQFPLIGITGTNGKTTTTYLVDRICREHAQKTALIGTIQMKIGDTSYPIKNTTPDALSLQRAFKEMVDENIDVAMMEVSSHALDLGRVYGCDFDIALFTNLSQDHLDYHTDMNDYLRAKTLLFTGLGNSYNGKLKYAILNADDAHSEKIRQSTAQAILTYGIEANADIMAKNIHYELKKTTFTLVTPNDEVTITSQLIGKFNIYNMLAAASIAYALQIPIETVKAALESMPGVDGRFEQVLVGQKYAVIVDYAHTPDSLENVLQTINEFAQKNVYVVVGTGGDRDRTKRPLMANVAVNNSDLAIFTSDNPRTEEPSAILNDMVTGLEAENFEVIENRKAAIYHAVNLADEGDIILIAGKGHETYQEIHGVRYDFDDRKIAKEAIEQRGI